MHEMAKYIRELPWRGQRGSLVPGALGWWRRRAAAVHRCVCEVVVAFTPRPGNAALAAGCFVWQACEQARQVLGGGQPSGVA